MKQARLGGNNLPGRSIFKCWTFELPMTVVMPERKFEEGLLTRLTKTPPPHGMHGCRIASHCMICEYDKVKQIWTPPLVLTLDDSVAVNRFLWILVCKLCKWTGYHISKGEARVCKTDRAISLAISIHKLHIFSPCYFNGEANKFAFYLAFLHFLMELNKWGVC